MADPRTIALVEKLLRLAAPSSNTTKSERELAALEAARLFSVHELAVAEKPRPRAKRPERPRSTTAPRVAVWYHGATRRPTGWVPVNVLRDAACASCSGRLHAGDGAWAPASLAHAIKIIYLCDACCW